MKILPGLNVQRVLKENFKVLVARTIVSFLPAFKSFQKLVPKHIKHMFTKEMTLKSEIVRIPCHFILY